ncbi:MAG: hypothetical protein JWL81_1246 [Verrucomicrobiales bacterium]|nr:hypothetical protein [Verrucomicrobiales bacterium]
MSTRSVPDLKSLGRHERRPRAAGQNASAETNGGKRNKTAGKWLSGFAFVLLLGGVFYRYENWHGARELAAAQNELLARAGTLDLEVLLPKDVAEEENYFAIPILKKWRVSRSARESDFELVVPESLEVTPSLIAELAAGLDRPYSQMTPSRRRFILDAQEVPKWQTPPDFESLRGLVKKLAQKLDSFVQTGDAANTRCLVGIMLKLGNGVAGEPALENAISGQWLQHKILNSLNAALAPGFLTELDLGEIQKRLLPENDLLLMEQTIFGTILETDFKLTLMRRELADGNSTGLLWNIKYWLGPYAYHAMKWGPRGWWDSNRAYSIDQMLKVGGSGESENWRRSENAAESMSKNLKAVAGFKIGGDHEFYNMRRVMACQLVPGLKHFWLLAAKIAALRRCAVLACALHRHRLLHGAFPKSLTELDAGLLPGPGPGPQMDPAKAEAELQYRVKEKGFLLWSVGMDRVDDGGDVDKDWIWRQGTL